MLALNQPHFGHALEILAPRPRSSPWWALRSAHARLSTGPNPQEPHWYAPANYSLSARVRSRWSPEPPLFNDATAAAIAVQAASHGRKTLVLTIDPARRLASSLGLEELGNEERLVPKEKFDEAGLPLEGSLHAMMLDTKRTFDDLVARLDVCVPPPAGKAAVGVDLDGTQARRRISGKKGVAGAGGEDHHLARREQVQRSAPVIGLADRLHPDRGEYPGWLPLPQQRILHRQCVHHGRQHSHLVAFYSVKARICSTQTPPHHKRISETCTLHNSHYC